jgi:defect-in-organelle-trafficking protein DotC
MNFKKPELPNAVLFPKNEEEEKAWKTALADGWEKGIVQADNIYNDNLARLQRDYKGMILYRKLLAMKMVTPPYVAKTDLGVTGDKNNLNIGDKVLRISALPGLETNSKEWKAYVVER